MKIRWAHIGLYAIFVGSILFAIILITGWNDGNIPLLSASALIVSGTIGYTVGLKKESRY